MTTYSLALTGAPAGQVAQVAMLKLPDNAGLPGDAASSMQAGAPLLCQRPDGSQRYYVLDAERSTFVQVAGVNVVSKLVLRPQV
jgi:hypothetical protein